MPKPHCVGCDEFRSCQSACGILHQYWNGQGECPGFKGFIKHVRGVTDQGVKQKHMLFTDSDSELFRGC